MDNQKSSFDDVADWMECCEPAFGENGRHL